MKKEKSNVIASVLLVLFCLAVILPLLTILLWVVTERWAWPDLLPGTLSLRAVRSVFRDGRELAMVFSSSVLISLAVAALAVLVGMMTARALECYAFFGRTFFSFLSLLPFVVPASVFAMGIQVLFLRIGLGGNAGGVIFVHLICSLPYAVQLLQDGTRGLGIRLEEQARVLGAGPLTAFRRVTLPNLLPVILSAFSMSYIVSFSQYFLTLIIGGGNVKTFTVVMVPFLTGGERNFASIYSIIFLMVTIVIFGVFELVTRRIMKNRDVEYFS